MAVSMSITSDPHACMDESRHEKHDGFAEQQQSNRRNSIGTVHADARYSLEFFRHVPSD